mmetsp:Transcript_13451/g.30167  ORF Transcript_13451/g.30167 Transcript_13451/m.30167 type:complete len:404 (+) Transcript_13451:114-1325(+)
MRQGLVLAILAVGHEHFETCSCECCEAELLTGADFTCSPLFGDDARLAPGEGGEFRSVPLQCPQYCSNGIQLDYSTFCYEGCAPASYRKGASCGEPTARLSHQYLMSKASALAPKVPRQPVQAPKQVAVVQHVATRAQGRFRLQGDPAKDPDWMKITAKGPSIASRAQAEAKNVDKLSTLAIEKQAEILKVTLGSQNAVDPVQSSTDKAAESAREAYKVEEEAEEIAESAREAAKEAARSVIKDEAKKLMKDEDEAAKQKGKKLGDELEKTFEPEGKKAAAEAQKPYMEAMDRVGKMAEQYVKAADGMSAHSANLQMEANMQLGDAYTWQMQGNLVKAQNIIQDAHGKMNLAISEAHDANGMYQYAQKLMGSLGDYERMAAAAAYHAEVLKNPDAPPPPKPIV